MQKESELSDADDKNLYGGSSTKPLPLADIDFDGSTSLETIRATTDDAEIGYCVKVDLKYPNKTKQKTRSFAIFPKSKTVVVSDLTD